MKSQYLAVGLALAFNAYANAQELEKCPWKSEFGDFEFQGDDGASQISWKPVGDGNAVIGTWNIEGNTYTELAGWQPERKTLVSNGYGPNGAYWEMRSTKVSATMFQGTMIDRRVDGSLYTGTWQCKRVNKDLFETLFVGVSQEGEAVEFKGKFKRKK